MSTELPLPGTGARRSFVARLERVVTYVIETAAPATPRDDPDETDIGTPRREDGHTSQVLVWTAAAGSAISIAYLERATEIGQYFTAAVHSWVPGLLFVIGTGVIAVGAALLLAAALSGDHVTGRPAAATLMIATGSSLVGLAIRTREGAKRSATQRTKTGTPI